MKNARWFVESPKPRARRKFPRFPPIPIAANSACQKRRGLPHIRRRLFADGYISKYWLPRNDKHNLQLPSRLSVANAQYAGLFFFFGFQGRVELFPHHLCSPLPLPPRGDLPPPPSMSRWPPAPGGERRDGRMVLDRVTETSSSIPSFSRAATSLLKRSPRKI